MVVLYISKSKYSLSRRKSQKAISKEYPFPSGNKSTKPSYIKEDKGIMKSYLRNKETNKINLNPEKE